MEGCEVGLDFGGLTWREEKTDRASEEGQERCKLRGSREGERCNFGFAENQSELRCQYLRRS